MWQRAAAGLHELRCLKVARLGDNMRQVAVTEGDKVEAQIRFGVEVNGYGVGELVRRIADVSDVRGRTPDGRIRRAVRDTERGPASLLCSS